MTQERANIQTAMQPVESSNLAAIGYEAERETLYVSFKHGGAYTYSDVPAEAHAELMAAESVGKHYAAHIRKQYHSAKVCRTCFCPIEDGVKGNYCGGDSCGADGGDVEHGG